jgi:hypothetical protein
MALFQNSSLIDGLKEHPTALFLSIDYGNKLN